MVLIDIDPEPHLAVAGAGAQWRRLASIGRGEWEVALQDDLQQLDEELSAGRLSAEDYRRQRDQLVAGTRQEGPQLPDAASGESTPGPADQRPESPFPPAFRWETSAPEDTQVIEPVRDQPGAEEASETTQVMTGGQAAGPPRGEDAERTQVMPGASPPVPAPQPGTVEPPWAQGYDSAPPWSVSDLPPVPEQQPDWVLKGPAENEKSPALTILSVLGAVLLLGAIALGSYWLWGRDGGSAPEPAASEATQAPPVQNTEPPKPPDPLQPADVGGLKENKNVRDFADVVRAGFLTDEEIGMYQRAGAGQSRVLITNFDEGKAVILVTEVPSPQQAITLREELTALQETYDFELAPPTRAGVLVAEIPETAADSQTIIRGHYASGSVVVRVEMTGPDPRATASRFRQVLDQQLQELPADG